jgi:hypothetical protein
MLLVRVVTAVSAFNHLSTEQLLLGLAAVEAAAGILQQDWVVTVAGARAMQTALGVYLPGLQTLVEAAAVFGNKQLLVLVVQGLSSFAILEHKEERAVQ